MTDNFRINQRIDRICSEFEKALSAKDRPHLADWLDRIEAEHRILLMTGLLEVDVELRIKSGLPVDPGDYRQLGDEAVAIVKELIAAADSPVSDETLSAASNKVTSTSKQIGPYKLLQQIGEGGMGTVWMAEQEKPIRRRVALKLIKAGVDNNQVVARFEAERQALAIMDHQNIAKVLDAGTTEIGQPYFVMELVQGIPFTKYCDQNRLSINERLELFIPVCKAIQHAHQKGIIHRDIKPSNVLVCLYDGKPVPKVIDFGLAKALQHQSKLTDKTMFTEFGQVVGTLQYMSPEQAEMNQLDIDTRTDVYSLGVMLYELLTGSTPIEQDSLRNVAILKVLETIRETDPPRPSARLSSSTNEALSGISQQRRIDANKLKNILLGELDWIVMKALEKDRTRRYETANGFAEDIHRYLTGDAIKARPPTTGYRVRKYVLKHQGFVVAVALIAVLLVLGMIGTSVGLHQAKIESGNARKAESLAKGETSKSLAAQKRLEESLARTNYYLAEARWDENRVGEAFDALERIPEQYRSIEWHYANKLYEGSHATIRGHEEPVSCIAINPDGLTMASGSYDNTIKLWDISTGKWKRTLEGHLNAIYSLAFDNEGTKLASGSFDATVKLWDVNEGRELLTLVGHRTIVLGIAFSPDGSWIATGSNDKTIRIWDAKSGELVKNLNGEHGAVRCLTFDKEGKQLVSGCEDSTIQIWDLTEDKVSRTLVGHSSAVSSICLSPDGSTLSSSSWDKTIRLWDFDSGSVIKILEGHKNEVSSVVFSPEGLELASGSWDRTVRIWNAESGKETRVFNGQ